MRNFVATPAEESILMSGLAEKMGEAGLPESEQQRLAAAARDEIEETAVCPVGGGCELVGAAPQFGDLRALIESIEIR